MNFDTAFDRLIGHEGGYVNDPQDPGGETKWGISKRSYPHLNIKELSREQAKEIYRLDFWNALGQNLLFPSMQWLIFDFAVNAGVSTAIRKIQQAIGVADDGFWGPVSQAAYERLSEADLILLFTAVQLEYRASLKNWPAHGKGWTRRVAKNLRYAAEDNMS